MGSKSLFNKDLTIINCEVDKILITGNKVK